MPTSADPLIVAKDGNVPAYRGVAYVVFERLPLANFGNRIPQLSFEVVRPVGRLERMVRAVTLIPGTTEFGYAPGTVPPLGHRQPLPALMDRGVLDHPIVYAGGGGIAAMLRMRSADLLRLTNAALVNVLADE